MNYQPAEMKIHLVIVQPERYVHSLCFLDTADYLQYWLQKQGVSVSIGKNRMRHDAVNIIFGAHLGIDPSWTGPQYCSFIFNLEQLGPGGAPLSPAYEKLLQTCHLIDYHPANVASCRAQGEAVPLIPFWNAPYLNPQGSHIALAERPIDLIFFGSINDERKTFIKRIEGAGWDVAVFDSPTYYDERDSYVRQAKAVINTSFYASARFEQVRAFNVLSQGTAFISYLQQGQEMEDEFRESVFWLNDQNFDDFFKRKFCTDIWYQEARAKYSKWIKKDPSNSFSGLLDRAWRRWQQHVAVGQPVATAKKLVQPWAGNYFKDAVNLSPDDKDQPDLTFDLCARQTWPWEGVSRWGQALNLPAGQVELIVIQRELDSAAQWRGLLGNALELLQVTGTLTVELPIHCIELVDGGRWRLKSGHTVMGEYTDNFWLSGLFSHRLNLIRQEGLDLDRKPCAPAQAAYFRLIFEKCETTPLERTTARMSLPDFGRRNTQVTNGSPPTPESVPGTAFAATPPDRSASPFEDGFSTPVLESAA